MPSLVVLDVLDVLLPVLTNMINLSLEPCVFTSDWKEALLKLLFSVDLTLLLRENFSGDRVKKKKCGTCLEKALPSYFVQRYLRVSL